MNKEVKITIEIPFIKVNLGNGEIPLTMRKVYDMDKTSIEELVKNLGDDIIRMRMYNHNIK